MYCPGVAGRCNFRPPRTEVVALLICVTVVDRVRAAHQGQIARVDRADARRSGVVAACLPTGGDGVEHLVRES